MDDIEHAGMTITIEQEQDMESPREWGRLGKMVCFHRRHNLGDKHEYDSDDYSGWSSLRDAIEKDEDVALILPLFLYDHSGLRMKVGSFQGLLPQGHAEFDSGQVGFIYVTKDALRKECNVKRIAKKTLEHARQVLESEVSAYDQFLSGDVWVYDVKDENGDVIDSLGGMYGYDYCLTEAKKVAERHTKTAKV